MGKWALLCFCICINELTIWHFLPNVPIPADDWANPQQYSLLIYFLVLFTFVQQRHGHHGSNFLVIFVFLLFFWTHPKSEPGPDWLKSNVLAMPRTLTSSTSKHTTKRSHLFCSAVWFLICVHASWEGKGRWQRGGCGERRNNRAEILGVKRLFLPWFMKLHGLFFASKKSRAASEILLHVIQNVYVSMHKWVS